MSHIHMSHETEAIKGCGAAGAIVGGLVGSLFGPAGTAVGAKVGCTLGLIFGAVEVADYASSHHQHTPHIPSIRSRSSD